MKLKFRGWSREVYAHTHDVKPMHGGPSRRYPLGKPGEALRWDRALSARGKVDGLGLNGDFLIEFQFEADELKNWLSVYVTEFPEEAIRLLAEMQAEAFINLAQRIQNTE